MLDVYDNFILLVLIPVVLGLLNKLFSDQILYFVGVFRYALFRPFDVDGNPSSPDWCLIYNPGNGDWSYVSVTYSLNPFSCTCGVHVTRYDSEKWVPVSKERFTFPRWVAVSKARIVLDAVPSGLASGPMAPIMGDYEKSRLYNR